MRSSSLIPLVAAVSAAVLPAPASAASPRLGDLVITEIAANPALPEPAAEFVVVDNVSSSTLLLDGLRLTDAAGGSRGAVPPDTSLEPGQRIALQPSAGVAAYACAPAPHRALIGGWAPLNNDGDTVALEREDGAVLDRVIYPHDAFPGDGRSRRVDPAHRTPAGNDSWSRWALSPAAASPCALPPPRPGRVRFAAAELAVAERAGAVRLTLRREAGSNGRIAVPYRTVDGSAIAGSDYRVTSGSVPLGATETTAAFDVPLIDDARDEPTESFAVVLGAPGGGATSTDPSRAVVRIADDDAAAAPVLTPTLPGAPAPFPPPRPGGGAGTPPRAPAGPGAAPGAPAPGRPGGPPTAGQAPRASVAVAGWQPVLRRGRLAVSVGCDAPCRIETEGDIALGRGRYLRLRPVTRRLAAHATVVVRLRVPGRRVRALRRALRRRGWLRAMVSATPDGGVAAERRVRIR